VKELVTPNSLHTITRAVPSLSGSIRNLQSLKLNMGVYRAKILGSNLVLVQLVNPPLAAVLQP
jgi:hypothetical protein